MLRQKDLVVGCRWSSPRPEQRRPLARQGCRTASGEYRIGVNADGFTQVAVDGQVVATVNSNT